MIDTIILLIESPFNLRDYQRYGVERLRNHGFDVAIWDVMSLTRPHSIGHYSPPDALDDKQLTRFISKKQFKLTISKLIPQHCIFINMIGCSIRSNFMYNALKKHHIQYVELRTGMIPLPSINKFQQMINQTFQQT